MTVILVGTGPPRLTKRAGAFEPRAGKAPPVVRAGGGPAGRHGCWATTETTRSEAVNIARLGTTGGAGDLSEMDHQRCDPREAQMVATEVDILDIAQSLRQRLVPSDLE